MTELWSYVSTAAGGGFIVMLGKWLLDAWRTPSQTRKVKADTEETAVGTALDLVRELRVEVDRAKEQTAELAREVEHLHALVRALESEIVTLGGDPTRVFRRFDPPEGTPV